MKIQSNNPQVKLLNNELIKTALNLKVGDIFDGQIIDIDKDSVLLKLLNGTKVNAKLKDDINLSVGKVIKFLVQSTTDNQTIVKPLKINVNGNSNLIENALKAADLPLTEQNTKILSFFVDNNIPINKETIEIIINQLNSKEKIPLGIVKFFIDNNLPVEKETIKYLQQCIEHQDKFNNNLLNLINKISDSILKNQDLDIIKIVFSDDFVMSKQDEFILNDRIIEQNQFIGKNNKIKIRNYIKKELIDKFFIKINDQNKLKQYNLITKDIYDKIIKLQKHCQVSENKDADLEKAISQAKNQFDSIKYLNKDWQSYQIPLQFSNHLTEGFLYMINKDGKNDKSENKSQLKTAVLSLNMVNLGQLNIFISINKKLINCIFNVENKSIKNIIERKLNNLKNSVNNKGYIIKDMKVNVIDIDKLIPLDIDKIKFKSKQYSFDMRV